HDKRPDSDTETIVTTHLPTINAAISDNDKPRTRSSFKPTIAKYAGIKNANDPFPKASSASENSLRFLCTTAKPARNAANTTLTSSAPATTQYPSKTAIA